MQKGKRWEVSLLNRGKGRGFWANVPPLSFLPSVEQGRGRRVAGGPIRALWATAAAGIEGERERELRGIDPLPHLERRWVVAARLRWPVAAGGGVRGGGAKGAEEELWRRWWLVVAKDDAEGAFYSPSRSVERCGVVWCRPASGAASLNGARPRSRVGERRVRRGRR